MKPMIEDNELEKYRFDSMKDFAEWCYNIYNSDTTSPMFDLLNACHLNVKAFPYFVMESPIIKYYGKEIGSSYGIFVTHNDLEWVLVLDSTAPGRYKFEIV